MRAGQTLKEQEKQKILNIFHKIYFDAGYLECVSVEFLT